MSSQGSGVGLENLIQNGRRGTLIQFLLSTLTIKEIRTIKRIFLLLEKLGERRACLYAKGFCSVVKETVIMTRDVWSTKWKQPT